LLSGVRAIARQDPATGRLIWMEARSALAPANDEVSLPDPDPAYVMLAAALQAFALSENWPTRRRPPLTEIWLDTLEEWTRVPLGLTLYPEALAEQAVRARKEAFLFAQHWVAFAGKMPSPKAFAKTIRRRRRIRRLLGT
jgi:hypothetical protein